VIPSTAVTVIPSTAVTVVTVNTVNTVNTAVTVILSNANLLRCRNGQIKQDLKRSQACWVIVFVNGKDFFLELKQFAYLGLRVCFGG